MQLNLRHQLTQFHHLLQTGLFPILNEELGELSQAAKRLVATLGMIPLARFVPDSRGWVGRPAKDRLAIANAFVAKAVYGFTHTRQLLGALASDAQLRQICGWKRADQVPHESTFSRAFDEFAHMELPQFVHEALIRDTHQGRLIGHIARDSTAIEARERGTGTKKPAKAAPQPTAGQRKQQRGRRGPNRRYKGGRRRRPPKDDNRLHRQRRMNLPEMLRELPRQCNFGCKTNASGVEHYWRGYKLHLDVADGQIPISAVLTSASVHDSQAAIPLAIMSTQRVTYFYELMDSAYDAHEILEHSQGMQHVPIVDTNTRRRGSKHGVLPGPPLREMSWAQADRYRERNMV